MVKSFSASPIGSEMSATEGNTTVSKDNESSLYLSRQNLAYAQPAATTPYSSLNDNGQPTEQTHIEQHDIHSSALATSSPNIYQRVNGNHTNARWTEEAPPISTAPIEHHAYTATHPHLYTTDILSQLVPSNQGEFAQQVDAQNAQYSMAAYQGSAAATYYYNPRHHRTFSPYEYPKY